MADEKEAADGRATAMPDTSGLAADVAMEEDDPPLRDDVAPFLKDQRGLIADQRHHLQKQHTPVSLKDRRLPAHRQGDDRQLRFSKGKD